MTGTYNVALVALSYLVASLAAYVACNLASRMAATHGRAATWWMAGGALAMGTGIWSMHFIGMLAFRLPVPTSYDVALTLLSLAIAVAASGVALFTIKRTSPGKLRLIFAGTILGIGIALVHYTGMASMRLLPSIRYDVATLTLSVVLAVAASIVALWLVVGLRSATVERLTQRRVASALVMGLAIAGMHYTGTAAAAFDPGTVCLVGPQQVNTVWLAATIACCTVLLLTGTLLIRGGERSLLADHMRHPMGVRLKIGLVCLVVVMMVSGFVIASLLVLAESADRAALMEVEDVAVAIGQVSRDAVIKDFRAQAYVDRIHRELRRDLFFVDTNKRIVADVEFRDVGTVFRGDADNAVGKTLSDGLSRTFLEVNSSSGNVRRQFVTALHSDVGDKKSPIIGALVLEYTQPYEAFHAAARNMASLIAAIGVAVVFLTSMLGLRAVASIAPPLIALKRGAESIAAGDYDTRVAVSSKDEIGALAAAFNRMAEDLASSHARLVDDQRDLEARVAERTLELQRAEESQRQIAGELRLVTEHVPVGLSYIDRNLRFHHHNRRYAALIGVPENEIDGRTLSETVDPALYELIKGPIEEVLAGRQVVYERKKVSPSEDAGNIQTTLVPRIDEQGHVVGFYAMLQDVSDRRQAEDALRRSNDQLKAINLQLREAQSQLLQAEKMASIGQLASGVAHEINNPIGYVCSNLGTFEHYLSAIFALVREYEAACETIGDPAVRQRLHNAREAADIDFVRGDAVSLLAESQEGITRVKQIVYDLKNFSRSASDETWHWADLHQGIDSTLNIVMNELKYKADISKRYGELPHVQCRSSQLNQVFLNLLVNCADAIKERGTITIRSGEDAEWVWIEFEDTGAGIAPEHIDRIFDPFFTTKPVGKGIGLGLAVSYGIVKDHGGRIEATSVPGSGTIMRVWLPIRQVAEDTAGAGAEPAEPAVPMPG